MKIIKITLGYSKIIVTFVEIKLETMVGVHKIVGVTYPENIKRQGSFGFADIVINQPRAPQKIGE